jgi:hypothetical protein
VISNSEAIAFFFTSQQAWFFASRSISGARAGRERGLPNCLLEKIALKRGSQRFSGEEFKKHALKKRRKCGDFSIIANKRRIALEVASHDRSEKTFGT